MMAQGGAKQLADAEDQLEAALDAALDMDLSEGTGASLGSDSDDGGPLRQVSCGVLMQLHSRNPPTRISMLEVVPTFASS